MFLNDKAWRPCQCIMLVQSHNFADLLTATFLLKFFSCVLEEGMAVQGGS